MTSLSEGDATRPGEDSRVCGLTSEAGEIAEGTPWKEFLRIPMRGVSDVGAMKAGRYSYYPLGAWEVLSVQSAFW